MPLIVLGVIYGFIAGLSLRHAIQRPELFLSVAFITLATLFILFLGIWTRRAADSFDEITTTTGRDIDHLMVGLDDLRKAFSLLSVIVKLYVALVIVSILVMVIVAIAGAFRG